MEVVEQDIAKYGMMPEMTNNPEGWGAILLLALEKACYGIFQLDTHCLTINDYCTVFT